MDKNFKELHSDSKYEKPSVTVDAVIFRIASQENNNYRKLPEKKLQVFLIKFSIFFKLHPMISDLNYCLLPNLPIQP